LILCFSSTYPKVGLGCF